MLGIDYVAMGDLSPVDLCKQLKNTHYRGIKILLKNLSDLAIKLVNSNPVAAREQLVQLFLKDFSTEVQKLIALDEQLLFKSIEAGKVPGNYELETLGAAADRVLNLLLKARNMLNNYVAGPEWDAALLDTCNEMFRLEQLLQQAIYIREQFLLKKLRLP